MNNVQLSHSERRNEKQTFPVRILAHDLRTPTNVGSLFRIADAFGIEHLHLSGASALPPNPKIRKTSRSTEEYVPYSHAPDPQVVVAQLKADGYIIVSLEITTTSLDVRRFKVSGRDRVCVIVGSENSGVSQALLDRSDHTIHVPMFGENSSMNVATACSVALFEIIKQYAA